MNINLSTNFSNNMKKDEIEIIINANQNSKELQNIINVLQDITNTIHTIVGFKNNEIYIIPTEDILYFYTNEQKCFCRTSNDIYIIKKRLYELDEKLDQEYFIRISNSCIVNIKYVKSFDLSKIGNVLVKLKCGEIQNVSKKRIPQIMKILKERWY